MIATGWLIRPDLIVTAGHVACDFDHGFGLLKSIKVYIGYDGAKTIHSNNVQYRQGKASLLNRTSYEQKLTEIRL